MPPENATKLPVTICNTPVERLRYARDTLCLSWRKIAQIEEFRDIPIRTLCLVYKGQRGIPKKWRARFGLPQYAPAPVCEKCGEVHVSRRCTKQAKPPGRWSDYSVGALRAALENRIEFNPEGDHDRAAAHRV